MFYSQFILAKKGPLGTIWIAAHLERKLRKSQVSETNIGLSVDSILFPEAPIALRLSGHLLLGVVRIYSKKVNYLFHDCSEALSKIKEAFHSVVVDLPPEAATAPYHTITLPETFDLEELELLPDDENLFKNGVLVDHHVTTREQITLQDSREEDSSYLGQFGLDERFTDGDASQMVMDLEEDLLMEKIPSPQEKTLCPLVKADATLVVGSIDDGEDRMEIDDKNGSSIPMAEDNPLERLEQNVLLYEGSSIDPPPQTHAEICVENSGYPYFNARGGVFTPIFEARTPDLNQEFCPPDEPSTPAQPGEASIVFDPPKLPSRTTQSSDSHGSEFAPSSNSSKTDHYIREVEIFPHVKQSNYDLQSALDEIPRSQMFSETPISLQNVSANLVSEHSNTDLTTTNCSASVLSSATQGPVVNLSDPPSLLDLSTPIRQNSDNNALQGLASSPTTNQPSLGGSGQWGSVYVSDLPQSSSDSPPRHLPVFPQSSQGIKSFSLDPPVGCSAPQEKSRFTLDPNQASSSLSPLEASWINPFDLSTKRTSSIAPLFDLSTSSTNNIAPFNQSAISSCTSSVTSFNQFIVSPSTSAPFTQSKISTSSNIAPLNQYTSTSNIPPFNQSTTSNSSIVLFNQSSTSTSSIAPFNQSMASTSNIPAFNQPRTSNSSIPPFNQSTKSTSSIAPLNQSTASTSSIAPFNQYSASTNNISPLNQSRISISSIAPLNQSSTSISSIAPFNQSSASTSNISPFNQSSTSTSTISPFNQSTASTSSIAPFNQYSASTRNISPLNQSRISTSSIAPLNQSSTSTSSIVPFHQSSASTSNISPFNQSRISTSSIAPFNQSSTSTSSIAPFNQLSASTSNVSPFNRSRISTSSISPFNQSSKNTSSIAPINQSAASTSNISPFNQSRISTGSIAPLNQSSASTNSIAPLNQSLASTNSIAPFNQSSTSTGIISHNQSTISTRSIAPFNQPTKRTNSITPLNQPTTRTSSIAPFDQPAICNSGIGPFNQSRISTSSISPFNQSTISTSSIAPSFNQSFDSSSTSFGAFRSPKPLQATGEFSSLCFDTISQKQGNDTISSQAYPSSLPPLHARESSRSTEGDSRVYLQHFPTSEQDPIHSTSQYQMTQHSQEFWARPSGASSASNSQGFSSSSPHRVVGTLSQSLPLASSSSSSSSSFSFSQQGIAALPYHNPNGSRFLQIQKKGADKVSDCEIPRSLIDTQREEACKLGSRDFLTGENTNKDNPYGKDRHFRYKREAAEENTPTKESVPSMMENTPNNFSIQSPVSYLQSDSTTHQVHDVLSSILGRLTPTFDVLNTPHESTATRRFKAVPKLTNRKQVILDNDMVLHGDMLRHQLANTESIRRQRRKAPCTLPEIWTAQKEYQGHQILFEPSVPELPDELHQLYYRVFGADGVNISSTQPTKDGFNLASLQSTEDGVNPASVQSTDGVNLPLLQSTKDGASLSSVQSTDGLNLPSIQSTKNGVNLPSVQSTDGVNLPSIQSTKNGVNLASVQSTYGANFPSIQLTKDRVNLASVQSTNEVNLPSIQSTKDGVNLASVQLTKDGVNLTSVQSTDGVNLASVQLTKDRVNLTSVKSINGVNLVSIHSNMDEVKVDSVQSTDGVNLASVQSTKGGVNLASLQSTDGVNNPSIQSTEDGVNLPLLQLTKDGLNLPSEQSIKNQVNFPSVQLTEDDVNLPSVQPTEDGGNLPSIQSTEYGVNRPSLQPTEDEGNLASSHSTKDGVNLPSLQSTKDGVNLPSVQSIENRVNLPSVQLTKGGVNLPSVQSIEDVANLPSIQSTDRVNIPSLQSTKDRVNLLSVQSIENEVNLPSVQLTGDGVNLPSVQSIKDGVDLPSIQSNDRVNLASLQSTKDEANLPSVQSIENGVNHPSVQSTEDGVNLPSIQSMDRVNLSPLQSSNGVNLYSVQSTENAPKIFGFDDANLPPTQSIEGPPQMFGFDGVSLHSAQTTEDATQMFGFDGDNMTPQLPQSDQDIVMNDMVDNTATKQDINVVEHDSVLQASAHPLENLQIHGDIPIDTLFPKKKSTDGINTTLEHYHGYPNFSELRDLEDIHCPTTTEVLNSVNGQSKYKYIHGPDRTLKEAIEEDVRGGKSTEFGKTPFIFTDAKKAVSTEVNPTSVDFAMERDVAQGDQTIVDERGRREDSIEHADCVNRNEEVDTDGDVGNIDFLTQDDDMMYEERDDYVIDSYEDDSLKDTTGWSLRTRNVARYLKMTFQAMEKSQKSSEGVASPNLGLQHLLKGKTQKEAARMFFETLVLKTKDCLNVEQVNAYDDIVLHPKPRLMKTNL